MEKSKTLYVKLYASCIPVKGAKRSTICDLEKGQIDVIPNDLFEIIQELENKSIDKLLEEYGVENKEVLQSYINFLIQKDYAFKTATPELFPPLETNYERPELITNAIIDVIKDSKHDFKSIAQSLDKLGCKDLQLRFFDEQKLTSLTKVLIEFKDSGLKSIELLIKYYDGLDLTELQAFCNYFPRIFQLVVHSSPFTQQIKGQNKSLSTFGNILFTTQIISDASHCGVIHPNNFTIITETYVEAKNYNSCLNKKISIDVNGEIKNCPSMPKSYGNLKDTHLTEIANNSDFQKVWGIKKDDINICKDCEFRYVCTDCRAYTEGNEPLNKPSKCSYDPFTATWQK